MPRRKVVIKKKTFPDSKYSSELIGQFINKIMFSGKKSTAERCFYNAMDTIKRKLKTDPTEVFEKAIENVKPMVEVRSRRIGGATYQIPIEVAPHRQLSLTMRWIINFSRKRSEKTYANKLAGELMDAYQNKGNSIKRKEDTHKMAEANKAFAHYKY
ncbi:30S ribosomal protein S7 [Candidatus Dependentiae bacterium]|nr:30S ribosomal protein S7 [Candidatus Dependentiae bacterium]